MSPAVGDLTEPALPSGKELLAPFCRGGSEALRGEQALALGEDPTWPPGDEQGCQGSGQERLC